MNISFSSPEHLSLKLCRQLKYEISDNDHYLEYSFKKTDPGLLFLLLPSEAKSRW